MNASIEAVRSATPEEWDAIWRACDYATYFHSREWAEIWRDYTLGKITPEPLMVSFYDGKRALLPLSAQKRLRGLVKGYLSSPAGTFGGWLSTDQLESTHGAVLTNYLTKCLGNLYWRLNPYDDVVSQLDVSITKEDETHVLNLGEGFEAIYKKWTKGHRSAAHKAQREGVVIKRSATIDDWSTYYSIYQDSLRRWGKTVSSSFSWELFETMAKCHSPFIEVWLATYQSEFVAGAVCLYARSHVAYWQGAALETYFHLRPVNLLLYEIIKHACENGYSWFDFNPSGGHEGVRAFKQSFGAETLHSPIKITKSKVVCLMDKITRFSR